MTRKDTLRLRGILAVAESLRSIENDGKETESVMEMPLPDEAVEFIASRTLYVYRHKTMEHKWLFHLEEPDNPEGRKWLLVYTDEEEIPDANDPFFAADEVSLDRIYALIEEFHNTPGFIINPDSDQLVFVRSENAEDTESA